MPEKARRTSWKHTPMPAATAPLPFEATYGDAQYAVIARGLVPEEMEDRWFVYEEEGVVCFHRSWTGVCVYRIRFEASGGVHRVVEAVVNRDPAEMGGGAADLAEDVRLLSFLFDRMLLGG